MSDTQTKQPVAGAVNLDVGTWYRAACSGMWYSNPMAAGSFDQIRIDGRRLIVEGGGCVALVDARDARKPAFDSSAWLEELEAEAEKLDELYWRGCNTVDERSGDRLLAAIGALKETVRAERGHSSNR